MARGESGRIVIEVEPEVKRRLYAALALTGSTLKDWFVRNAATFCSDTAQPSLFDPTIRGEVEDLGGSKASPSASSSIRKPLPSKTSKRATVKPV